MGVSQVVLVEVEQACSVAFQSIEQAGVSDSVEIFRKRVDDSLDLSAQI